MSEEIRSSVGQNTGVGKAKVGPRARLTLLIVAGCLFIGVVAGGVYFVLRNMDKTSKTETVVLSKTETIAKAQKLTTEGKYPEAKTLLEGAIKRTKIPGDITEYEMAIYTLAMQAKVYGDAQLYAIKLDKANPTSGSAHDVAYAATLNGDKETAKKYLQTAIDKLDKTKPQSGIILHNYEYELKELQR